MTSNDRRHLAMQQQALMDVLSRQGPTPAGMDSAQVSRLAATLLSKRSRAVARGLPRLTQALGTSFATRFAVYAREVPYPADERDAWRFVDWLSGQPGLDDLTRLALLPLLVRDRFPVQVCRLTQSPVLAVAVRCPALGVRVWQIKWRGRHFARSKTMGNV